MGEIAAIAVAFLLAFALKAAGMHLVLAWLASCCVVPAFLFIAAYVPGSGRATMWPFTMFVWAVYGAAAGGVGALFAALVWKEGAAQEAVEQGRTGADV